MNAALAVQKAIRNALVNDANILALIPAANIVDRNGRPAAFPSIILGDNQVIDDTYEISGTVTKTVFANLHIWAREPGSETVTHVAGIMDDILRHRRFSGVDGTSQIQTFVESARFIRDPDGETAHGIVTLRARVVWGSAP